MTQKELDEVLESHKKWLAGTEGRRADLRDANLRYANLVDADLRGADLFQADLRHANLISADLFQANLVDADLRGADLRDANLRYANLIDADLRDADLRHAKNIPDYVWASTNICPEGDLIVWKALLQGVAKLKIPAGAKRSNATGRKCRAEYAEVLELFGCDVGRSRNYKDFFYKVGETVRPTKPFCEDRWDECASGIHFFLTRYEAETY